MPDTKPFAPYSFALRVYWEDTDAGGVVFYANYLKFFERARTEWLRTAGVGQERLRHDDSVMFMVTETALRYLRPARLDDVIEVSVAIHQAGRVRLTLFQQAHRVEPGARELLAEGTIAIAAVDAGTYRPCRIPNSVLALAGPFSQ